MLVINSQLRGTMSINTNTDLQEIVHARIVRGVHSSSTMGTSETISGTRKIVECKIPLPAVLTDIDEERCKDITSSIIGIIHGSV